MKITPFNSLFSAILITLLITSCKDSKEESTSGSDTQISTEMPAGDDGGGLDDANRERQDSTSSANANASGSSSQGVNEDDYSGDGSDGRSPSTLVNTSKNVQMGTNKKKEKGWSAPDGTAAENTDGDMYTKHDTTRMPSGSTPIK